MNLKKVNPNDIIHINLSTYLDQYGMLVEAHDTQKGTILNSSFEIVYRIPSKTAEFRMVFYGNEKGKDAYKMYFRRPKMPWILISGNYPMSQASRNRIEVYKALLHKHFLLSASRKCKDYLAIAKNGEVYMEGVDNCLRISSMDKALNRKCVLDVCSDYK